jgi:hypothetical protein
MHVPVIEDRLARIPKRKSLSVILPLLQDLVHEKFHDCVQIFTDGSVMNEGNAVGSGIWVPLINFKIKHKLPAGSSVFSAEA